MTIDIEFFDKEQLEQLAKEWGAALIVAADLQRNIKIPQEG